MNIKNITTFLLLIAMPSVLFAARPSINVLNTRVNQLEAENNTQQSEIDALRASQCALYQQLFNSSLIGSLTVPTYCPAGPNTPPPQPGISIVPAAPDTTNDLLCNIDAPSIDVDGDTVTYSYSWSADGALQGGQTTDTVLAAHTQVGDEWECMVTPNDGTDDGAPAVTSVFIQ